MGLVPHKNIVTVCPDEQRNLPDSLLRGRVVKGFRKEHLSD